ncbi:hypothetical protein M3181_08385 [Mesobacillus maritimus]|uniref:hypothetical protein n=1 Tax=Mesobacillus maritimus TaxID=1643336 RepID=UPI00203D969E|nr:hypothetical protein [Mesobacillus maritimus]MCM3669017.1 hypothetical protein [Mesobacillus maritimus]
MSNEEKFMLLAKILKQEHMKIGLMTDDKLKDYIECISIYLKTKDDIVAEGAIKTIYMMTKNIEP